MQMKYDRCPNCMNALQGNEDTCQFCGFEISKYEEKPTCLRPFTVLQNKYMLGRVIGVGGFGITYIGWDLNLQTYIAIKEYFPETFASRDTSVSAESTQVIPHANTKDVYDKGLKRYVEEAQNLSKFYQLQGIVSVKDFFYENGTGYIVMEYINGINLKEFLNNSGGRLDEATVLGLMKPVFESLFQIHNAGLIHRDISPDNIMVDKDSKIKLIDFGSARGNATENEKTYTVILKHGYAPSEQYYAKGNQGPWTDIYSLCATMYKMLTGQIPPNSVERMENDEYVDPSTWGVQVSPRTEAVLRKGLAVKVNERYQNIGQLLNDLFGTGDISAVPMGMPTAAAPSFANPASMSQQSMHLSMTPVMAAPAAAPAAVGKTGSKKGILIVAGIAVALLIAIILILFTGKDDKDKNNKKTTEASTDEPSTEDGKTDEPSTDEPSSEDASTGNPNADLEYVWPTELSDDWRDYQIKIEDTVYQFPMPYTAWESAGWESKYLPTSIASGTYESVDFYIDKVECTAIVANYGLAATDIEECFVIGISINGEWDEISPGAVIEIAGGITYNVSTLEDIKASYGAPDYIYEGDDYTSVDYVGDELEDGVDLELNSDGVLRSIGMINSKLPDGYVIDTTQMDTNPPAINANYVAPDGPSTDRMDGIVTIDGYNYKLPVPAAMFTANGWIFDTATDDYISGNSYTTTSMEKNGNKINVTLENYTTDSILPINAIVTSISVDIDYCELEVLFPGDLSLGDQGSKFADVYGDLGDDYTMSKYTYSTYYRVWSWGDTVSLSIYAYADTETGEITQLSLSREDDDLY